MFAVVSATWFASLAAHLAELLFCFRISLFFAVMVSLIAYVACLVDYNCSLVLSLDFVCFLRR